MEDRDAPKSVMYSPVSRMLSSILMISVNDGRSVGLSRQQAHIMPYLQWIREQLQGKIDAA